MTAPIAGYCTARFAPVKEAFERNFDEGGEYNGVRLFTPEVIRLASEEQWHHPDSMFGNDFRVALGLLLNIDFNYWGKEGNVGTAGAGGYAAFADPDNGIS